MLQSSGNGNAAIYFYNSFLKCRIADNASRQTKRFFELARDTIKNAPIKPYERMDLLSDLISYIRGNQKIIHPREFASIVLPAQIQDSFVKTCENEGLTEGITKDVQLIKNSLRRHSIKFSSNVTISCPADKLKSSVRIRDDAQDQSLF